MNLLITVPHGFCPPSLDRECDTRSLSAARIIGKSYGDYNLVYIPKKRKDVDLNRKRPVVNSEIWDNFNKRIMKKLRRNTLLLDVHSFPIGSFEGAQIAILELSDKDRPELKRFVDICRRFKLNVKLFKGKGNYIQDFYKDYSYPLLLEFCEDKTYLKNSEIELFSTLLFSFF